MIKKDIYRIIALSFTIIFVVWAAHALTEMGALHNSQPSIDTHFTPHSQVVEETSPASEEEPVFVGCTEEALLCPDGSVVGREGPDCEFAACPPPADEIVSETVVCTDAMKQAEACTMEYAPVCGIVEVQCVTTPCPPIEETFSNGCSACAQGNVLSYTEGACGSDV